ncbi:bifunctional 4-hydroxy-2-oxoglutarate aldolase/2-dehydro-3-deoxy-phosphogluconate aldolase [Agrococcus jejuensis]|uniref:bifunctional 4-hydroxy-2-oxoglutarate aldolase/2-dehydro-3-deoxy-phosphogluconate aldolase n=1 Tax=Agrococcus jejuensis TaxID=399736 RepID=UPI00119D9AAC|nr:bifunctional 4-hydroxy-2-oxoglutarate aldolase/2-dehydro-3-deoxy-phosphogluconate aldolase [Agrococcus jejuensis]
MSAVAGHRLVPLAAPSTPGESAALADGLVAGGIGIVEVALRTPHAMDALRTIASRGDLVAGAGTVLDADQARAAIDAGARFLVSPGLSADVVAVAQAAGVDVLPGVMTATEVTMARDLGLRRLKLFPAGVAGGLALLDAYASVFADVTFMPSGGVSESTLATHLAHPAVFAVSGSWLAAGPAMREGADAVAAIAARAVAIAEAVPA